MGKQTMLEYKPFLWWRLRTFLSGLNSWLITQSCGISNARSNQNHQSSLGLAWCRYDQRGQNYHQVRLVPLVEKFPRGVHTVEVIKSQFYCGSDLQHQPPSNRPTKKMGFHHLERKATEAKLWQKDEDELLPCMFLLNMVLLGFHTWI